MKEQTKNLFDAELRAQLWLKVKVKVWLIVKRSFRTDPWGKALKLPTMSLNVNLVVQGKEKNAFER